MWGTGQGGVREASEGYGRDKQVLGYYHKQRGGAKVSDIKLIYYL